MERCEARVTQIRTVSLYLSLSVHHCFLFFTIIRQQKTLLMSYIINHLHFPPIMVSWASLSAFLCGIYLSAAPPAHPMPTKALRLYYLLPLCLPLLHNSYSIISPSFCSIMYSSNALRQCFHLKCLPVEYLHPVRSSNEWAF